MKYFVVSDIHSFYNELRFALKLAGFDKRNKDHTLIVCGDVFDRGHQTMEVYNFLRSIPKKRCILIKGNHEELFENLLKKGFPDSYDFHNGTVRTFCQIAGVPEEHLSRNYWYVQELAGELPPGWAGQRPYDTWKEIIKTVKESGVYKWLRSNQWINFFELNKYVFVHSFIPSRIKPEFSSLLSRFTPMQIHASRFEYMENWRDPSVSWEWATWGSPLDQFDYGLFGPEAENGKVLVVGHWHASDFHERYENDYSDNFGIYFGEHLIALDACTVISEFCNVLIIDDQDWVCRDFKGPLSVVEKKHIPIIETVTAKD